MGKAKREAKRQAKKARQKVTEEERKAAQIAADQAAVSLRRRRWTQYLGTPIITGAVAAGAYWGLENKARAGLILFGGLIVLGGFALGHLGGSVTPRGRKGADGINFGTRR